MKGGYPLPHPKTYDEEARAGITEKLAALKEASIFTVDDLDLSPSEKDSFHALLGHDYVFLYDAHFTQIIETPYLRRLPAVPLLIAELEAHLNVQLRETGDRTAWKIGIKKWEPIKGFRYYTTGKELTVSLGMKKIKLIPHPEDLPSLEDVSDFELALYDIYHEKEARSEILDWCKFNQDAIDRLLQVSQIRKARGAPITDISTDENKSDDLLDFIDGIVKTLRQK